MEGKKNILVDSESFLLELDGGYPKGAEKDGIMSQWPFEAE